MHNVRVRTKGEPGSVQPMAAPAGSGHVNAQGYKLITHAGKRKLEHRHIMEQVLGRSLTSSETVHHKFGFRSINEPDGLELWHKGQPAGQRVSDKVEWCLSFLKMYPQFVSAAGYVLKKEAVVSYEDVRASRSEGVSNDTLDQSAEVAGLLSFGA